VRSDKFTDLMFVDPCIII